MTSSPTMENPREAEAKPPFPQESLEYPGLESASVRAPMLRATCPALAHRRTHAVSGPRSGLSRTFAALA